MPHELISAKQLSELHQHFPLEETTQENASVERFIDMVNIFLLRFPSELQGAVKNLLFHEKKERDIREEYSHDSAAIEKFQLLFSELRAIASLIDECYAKTHHGERCEEECDTWTDIVDAEIEKCKDAISNFTVTTIVGVPLFGFLLPYLSLHVIPDKFSAICTYSMLRLAYAKSFGAGAFIESNAMAQSFQDLKDTMYTMTLAYEHYSGVVGSDENVQKKLALHNLRMKELPNTLLYKMLWGLPQEIAIVVGPLIMRNYYEFFLLAGVAFSFELDAHMNRKKKDDDAVSPLISLIHDVKAIMRTVDFNIFVNFIIMMSDVLKLNIASILVSVPSLTSQLFNLAIKKPASDSVNQEKEIYNSVECLKSMMFAISQRFSKDLDPTD